MKLREVCPALYNQEDALSSKAQEILIKARNQTNQREKDQMIQEAITICKEVAAKLNLDVLTSHLVAVHAYIGVLEVVLAAASKKDPQGKMTKLNSKSTKSYRKRWWEIRVCLGDTNGKSIPNDH